MKLRTRTFENAKQADGFEVPEGAHNFRVHPEHMGTEVVATWYERNPDEQAWGHSGLVQVRPSVLALEAVPNVCKHCNASEASCGPSWAQGRKCCPDCSHGSCRLMGRPHIPFRAKGIALLGVTRGAQIQRLRVGTMALGAGSEQMPAELLQPHGGAVIDKLGELGIAEMGDVEGITSDSVGKLIEVLEMHTPFVARAFTWPTAHPGHVLLLELEGYCRGAILWGFSAHDMHNDSDEPR